MKSLSKNKKPFLSDFDNSINNKIYYSIFETSHDAIIITDKNKNIIDVNNSFIELTGYTKLNVLGKEASFLEMQEEKKFYNENRVETFYTNIYNEKNPCLLDIKIINNSEDEIENYLIIFTDIKERKLSEQQFEFIAYHDILTELPNRLLLLLHLERFIEESKRSNLQTALLFLDLDRFKNVNDSFGHGMGDELLQKVALRLKKRLRKVDLISRLGGDEFAILLHNIKNNDAGHIAKEIISIISEPWLLSNGIEVRIGVSIGICIYSGENMIAENMLQFSDAALYCAKAQGKNRFVYYENDMTIQARYKIELESKLRKAIERKEFKIYFQPQINILSGEIIGAEALIRWKDPVKGLILPDEFISIAEETGPIIGIGNYVLEEVCIQGKKWLEKGYKSLKLSVNISTHQLKHSDFVKTFSEIIERTGFIASNLELEITESSLITNEENVIETLHKLRFLGVQLSIDDFGTGYSSLSYLKRLPLDSLKIDKSFIKDIPILRDDMDITRAIIKMGHTLGFKITAEGVENIEQLNFLSKEGCDYFQGYFESCALPVNLFEENYLEYI